MIGTFLIDACRVAGAQNGLDWLGDRRALGARFNSGIGQQRCAQLVDRGHTQHVSDAKKGKLHTFLVSGASVNFSCFRRRAAVKNEMPAKISRGETCRQDLKDAEVHVPRRRKYIYFYTRIVI